MFVDHQVTAFYMMIMENDRIEVGKFHYEDFMLLLKIFISLVHYIVVEWHKSKILSII